MTEEAAVWKRLAALLPEAEAARVGDCWSLGEQEAGLGLLVDGLVAHRVPIGEAERARISVLAEGWGEREALAPRILRCRGDGAPPPVRLIEDCGDVGAADGADVLVPWIVCERCGCVLARTHTREPWGGLSFLAGSYVLVPSARDATPRVCPADAVDEAFAALPAPCAEHTTDR
ncbi:hypothetical protein [Streptomyces hydrogenans]|uniref:hypothetical protein n=1 Tax=Streptomyces hydrogenans TaxID=1873719 RepID=UPI0037F213B7